MLHLDNPIGIILIYLGFGAGLSVFIFSGFVKSIPLDIEEAATIDGCNPIQTFFRIVLPILKPTAITVAILNAMLVSLLLTTAVIYVPALALAFGFEHISLIEYSVALALAFSVIPIVEIVKVLQRKFSKQ